MRTKLTAKQIEKYMPYMDSKLSAEYFAAILLGQKSFLVGDGLINIWKEAKKEDDKRKRMLLNTAKNNNIGITFEKEDKIKEAIKVYEKNIRIGYPALHSYERLMILYRKENMIDKEIEVIDKALNLFSEIRGYEKHIDKWEKRKIKAEMIKTK